jgi:hypothetical protein
MRGSVKKLTVSEAKSALYSEKGKIQRQVDKLLKPRGQDITDLDR